MKITLKVSEPNTSSKETRNKCVTFNPILYMGEQQRPSCSEGSSMKTPLRVLNYHDCNVLTTIPIVPHTLQQA